jgi:hypothetical protein
MGEVEPQRTISSANKKPKKSKLVVLLIAGIVVVICFVVVVLILVPSKPMRVTLQSYTNGHAVISIKNLTSDFVDYAALVEHKIRGEWPQSSEWPVLYGFPEGLPPGMSKPPDPEYGSLGPGQQTNLAISGMMNAASWPWHISVSCRRPFVSVSTVRYRTGVWCWNHGLHNVANKLLGGGSEFQFVAGQGPLVGQRTIHISTPEKAP